MPEIAVNLVSAFSHPGLSFLKDPPGAVGSFSAPGDQVNRPSRSGTDRIVLTNCIQHRRHLPLQNKMAHIRIQKPHKLQFHRAEFSIVNMCDLR